MSLSISCSGDQPVMVKKELWSPLVTSKSFLHRMSGVSLRDRVGRPQSHCSLESTEARWCSSGIWIRGLPGVRLEQFSGDVPPKGDPREDPGVSTSPSRPGSASGRAGWSDKEEGIWSIYCLHKNRCWIPPQNEQWNNSHTCASQHTVRKDAFNVPQIRVNLELFSCILLVLQSHRIIIKWHSDILYIYIKYGCLITTKYSVYGQRWMSQKTRQHMVSVKG